MRRPRDVLASLHHRLGPDRVISFVWSPGEPLPAGTGGSENYTTGQVRELNRRGVDARIVTCGLGDDDGRAEWADIPFHALASFADVADLDDTVVFVSEAPPMLTRHQAYQNLHVPPPLRAAAQARLIEATRDRVLIATSQYAARLWADFLDVDLPTIHVVHPFAEPVFATVPRAPRGARARVLYAGRLSPEKGIYTLLATLHSDLLDLDRPPSFTVTTAGSDKPGGRLIEAMVRTHPRIDVVAARSTAAEMAVLVAEHDVVVMPSNAQYWHETFGIVSIEAQHAGARVVASDDGGLPETQCGGLLLVEPDDAEELARGIVEALALDERTEAERELAAGCFTVTQSVDALVRALHARPVLTPSRMVEELEALISLPAVEPVRRAPDADPTAAVV